MKKGFLLLALLILGKLVVAQCSVCTKTAEQLGEGPATALNNAIIYLMFAPLLLMAFIGYKWYKREKAVLNAEKNG